MNMSRLRIALLGLMALAAVFLASALQPKKHFSQKEQLIMHALFGVMDAVHIQPKEIDDDYSKKAFDNYLDALDGSRRFLLEREVDQLRQFETSIDDQITRTSLQFFDLSNQLIEEATARAEEIYRDLIASPIDVNTPEILEMDGEKKPFPSDLSGLRDEWRKMIKYQMVAKIDRKLERQEKADTASVEKKKTIKEIEEDARKETQELLDDMFTRLNRIRRSDRFELYLSTFAQIFDPHSGYFSPKDKEDYDINIGGRLEGIGARLSQSDDYVKVSMIVPGGPAWKEGELEVDDLIMVVTEEGKDPVDLIGMRVDDAVQYIRGPKGTTVVLTVKKKDGTVLDISIERDEVIIDASFARSVILDLDDQVQDIGYIRLPAFYSTFDGGNSCAADVAKEIEELKAEKVNGIILDLRYNGGGSLPDVIQMSGLFIEEGPVVQVKSKGRSPYVHSDEDEDVAYNGPLIVLVNTISASASEILAAAMQDYERAIIVGSKSTYGKATVQRFFDLDRAIQGNKQMKPLGQVKLTMQKFYRVNGASTQLRGVVPDIILPDQFSYREVGERESEEALPWSEIKPVPYEQNVYHVSNIDQLRRKSADRIAKDSVFQLIDEKAHLAKELEDETSIQISLAAYRAEMDERDLQAKKFNEIMKDPVEGLMVTTLEADRDYLDVDESRVARHEDWIKQVKKDVYIKESLLIMKDMLQSDGKLVKH